MEASRTMSVTDETHRASGEVSSRRGKAHRFFQKSSVVQSQPSAVLPAPLPAILAAAACGLSSPPSRPNLRQRFQRGADNVLGIVVCAAMNDVFDEALIFGRKVDGHRSVPVPSVPMQRPARAPLCGASLSVSSDFRITPLFDE